jgi:hypothetical protein
MQQIAQHGLLGAMIGKLRASGIEQVADGIVLSFVKGKHLLSKMLQPVDRAMPTGRNNSLVYRSKAFVCRHDLNVDGCGCVERAAIGPVGIDAIDQFRAQDAVLRSADNVPDAKLQRR